MGEYAMLGKDEVKIGTCENMYYLRADQRHMVQPLSGNVNVHDAEQLKHVRFRFPWPDEDDCSPGGEFHDRGYFRSLAVRDVKLPTFADVEHYSIQFCAEAGLLVSLPCPNGKEPNPFKIHRNGYAGDVQLVQQRFWEGQLWSVCRCGACGALWRLPPADAEALAVALRSMADVERARFVPVGDKDREASRDRQAEFYHKVADRVMAGYAVEAEPRGPEVRS